MKNTDLIKMPAAETGMTISMPAWCLLEGISLLSDEDKAAFATTVVGLIGDSEESNQLALTVLQQRCRECGRRIHFDETCHCQNEE